MANPPAEGGVWSEKVDSRPFLHCPPHHPRSNILQEAFDVCPAFRTIEFLVFLLILFTSLRCHPHPHLFHLFYKVGFSAEGVQCGI